MADQKKSTQVLAHINSLTPSQLVEDNIVADKFMQLYNNVHGAKNGELFYHKEKFNFLKLMSETPAIKECTQLSLYGCFLDVAVNGLSFEQGNKPLVYIIPRNCNSGTKDNPKWEKRAQLIISPYGELVTRMRSGQIKHADNPVVVYDGDIFSVKTDENGNRRVYHEMTIPRKSTKTIGAFMKITRADGSIDFAVMLEDDIKRLSEYSSKQNKGTTNALYTSCNGQIDPGFLQAKVIRHAFKTYPKVRIGEFTSLETQIEEDATPIDYGFSVSGPNNTIPIGSESVFGEVREEVDNESTITFDSETF